MTRRTTKSSSNQRQRLLRLALSVSVISSPVLVASPTAFSSEGTSAEIMPTAIELPAFPLPESQVETQISAQVISTEIWTEARAASRIALVQRWLGLGQRARSQTSIANSMVVPASALEKTTAVVESLSDRSAADCSGSENIDPSDLLTSLDEVVPSLDDTETSLSLSDRDDSDFGSAHPISTPRPREPQIVNTHQPLVLRTGSTIESQPTNITTDELRSEANTRASSVSDFEQSDKSSRRGIRPEPMKIQILGSSSMATASVQNVPQREPLVAMLATYPSQQESESSASKVATLKELIRSDRTAPYDQQSVTDDTTGQDASSLQHTDSMVVDADQHFTVGLGESIQLKCENRIQGVSVEREDVCQLIQTGPRSYSLIGLQEGVTRIALITEVAGQRQIEIHQVSVDSRVASGSDLESLADSIGQTLRQLYPLNRVAVDVQERRLVVRGKVDSEESARRIISLVRKTALAPVVDQLTTY